MEQKVRTLIKEAMLEKNKAKLLTYKSILEQAQKIAKAKSAEGAVTEDDIIQAIQKEEKQLKDLEPYCAKDPAKAAEIAEKLEYCKAIMPQRISDQEVLDYLTETSAPKSMRACMKALKDHFGSRLDGKSASAVVKAYLEAE